MKHIFLIQILMMPLLTIAQEEDEEIVYEIIHIGPDREYKDLGEYFTEDRAYVDVVIDEGEYYNDGEIWIGGHDINITGNGKVVLNCTDQYENVMWVSGKNIFIHNLTLKHHKPGSNMQNCTGKVIAFDNATDCTVMRCDINGCGSVGVHDNVGNSNIRLVDNYIHYNSVAPFGDIDGNIWMEEVEDHPVFVFDGNRIENNGPDRRPEDGQGPFLSPYDFDEVQADAYNDLYSNWLLKEWPAILGEFNLNIDCADCPALTVMIEMNIDDAGIPQSIRSYSFYSDCSGFYERENYMALENRIVESIKETWRFEENFFNTGIRIRVGQALKC